MSRKNPLDKRRSAADMGLKEIPAAVAKVAAAHRGPNKRFNHPDIKRGAGLAKQSRPDRRKPEELLEELAQIRKIGSERKKLK